MNGGAYTTNSRGKGFGNSGVCRYLIVLGRNVDAEYCIYLVVGSNQSPVVFYTKSKTIPLLKSKQSGTAKSGCRPQKVL